MGVPKWECLSGSGPKWACLRGIRYGRACASGCARVCDACASLLCTDRCGRRHARRRLHGQASSSGAIIPIRIFHTHTHREARRGAARHNKGMSRADENHRACILGRGGGSGRASAMPCLDRRMAGPPPLLGLACTHAAWHWPGSGIPSRSVASTALHTLTVGFIGSCHSLIFSIFFVQHVTGPATLVSTSGV